jgi:hypothetical protein
MCNNIKMDTIKNIAIGGMVTLTLGGVAYSFSHEDFVNNFAEESGLSQEQAEVYISDSEGRDGVSFGELADDLTRAAAPLQEALSKLDCESFSAADIKIVQETYGTSCEVLKMQGEQFTEATVRLSQSYRTLDGEVFTIENMVHAINSIDNYVETLDSQFIMLSMGTTSIAKMKLTGAYNKSVIKTAVESTE